MSLYDIAMIIVFLGAIWFGYWKGLAWQIASVAAIFLSYFVAVTFPDAISPYISAEPPFNRFAAMLILFIGTSLIVWTIFASVSKSIAPDDLLRNTIRQIASTSRAASKELFGRRAPFAMAVIFP